MKKLLAALLLSALAWTAQAQDALVVTTCGTLPLAYSAGSTRSMTVDTTGKLCLSSTGVTSVSNADGTLTISPTTGAVVASLNLAHSNTWTAAQAISPSATNTTPLTLTDAGSISGTVAGNATLVINRGSNSQSGLDIIGGNLAGNLLRIFTAGQLTNPLIYVNDGSHLFMRTSAIISGHFTGANINPPTADATMLSLWADVTGPVVQMRANAGAVGERIFDGLDSSANYTFSLANDGTHRWGAGATYASQDTFLRRDASNILAMANASAGQSIYLYNVDDPTNYERGVMQWSGNNFNIGTTKGGSGTLRNTQFINGTNVYGYLGQNGGLTTKDRLNLSDNAATDARKVVLSLSASTDGVLTLYNNATTSWGRLNLGGDTSAFPAIKRSGTTVAMRLADDSADAPISGSTITLSALANIATTSAVCYNTGTGVVSYDGTLGTCTVSDERLKNMGERIPNALARLLQINGVYYTWKDPTWDRNRQIGVSAQNIEKIFPELVQTDNNGHKSADYSRLTAPIIEAMRELNTKVEKLEAR